MPNSRTKKLDLRLSPQAKQRSVAAETLADRRVWRLNAAQWEAFQAALAAPLPDNPALRNLLTRPSAVEFSQQKGR